MVRNSRVPWEGRSEDRTDDRVWAVTCFVTRAGFRKRGVSQALARAAVEHALAARRPRRRGPSPHHDSSHLRGDARGLEKVFLDAGFAEVSRPGLRRVVMRIDV